MVVAHTKVAERSLPQHARAHRGVGQLEVGQLHLGVGLLQLDVLALGRVVVEVHGGARVGGHREVHLPYRQGRGHEQRQHGDLDAHLARLVGRQRGHVGQPAVEHGGILEIVGVEPVRGVDAVARAPADALGPDAQIEPPQHEPVQVDVGLLHAQAHRLQLLGLSGVVEGLDLGKVQVAEVHRAPRRHLGSEVGAQTYAHHVGVAQVEVAALAVLAEAAVEAQLQLRRDDPAQPHVLGTRDPAGDCEQDGRQGRRERREVTQRRGYLRVASTSRVTSQGSALTAGQFSPVQLPVDRVTVPVRLSASITPISASIV